MERGVKHNTPHIHAKYNEYDVSVDFNGNILAGNLPQKQMKLIDAWIVLHQNELIEAWDMYIQHGKIIKIKGLE